MKHFLVPMCLTISPMGFADGWSPALTITDVQFSTSSHHMTITFTPELPASLLPASCNSVGGYIVEQPGDFAKSVVLSALVAGKPIEMYISNGCVFGRPTASIIRIRK